jgi:uncharacterized tellurite resistance protein B-like protein
MFERILQFLKELPGHEASGSHLDAEDPRVAAAAILIHVMEADGVNTPQEQARLRETLARTYGLQGDELAELIKAADEAEKDSVDLYGFTSVLKRHLGEEARSQFIRLMWEIVLADGEVHELEDNLVWRVAELIGVDSRTRVVMRQKVQESASKN